MGSSCQLIVRHRPYTPISPPDQVGSVKLMVKEYKVEFTGHHNTPMADFLLGRQA